METGRRDWRIALRLLREYCRSIFLVGCLSLVVAAIWFLMEDLYQSQNDFGLLRSIGEEIIFKDASEPEVRQIVGSQISDFWQAGGTVTRVEEGIVIQVPSRSIASLGASRMVFVRYVSGRPVSSQVVWSRGAL